MNSPELDRFNRSAKEDSRKVIFIKSVLAWVVIAGLIWGCFILFVEAVMLSTMY